MSFPLHTGSCPESGVRHTATQIHCNNQSAKKNLGRSRDEAAIIWRHHHYPIPRREKCPGVKFTKKRASIFCLKGNPDNVGEFESIKIGDTCRDLPNFYFAAVTDRTTKATVGLQQQQRSDKVESRRRQPKKFFSDLVSAHFATKNSFFVLLCPTWQMRLLSRGETSEAAALFSWKELRSFPLNVSGFIVRA